MVVFASVRPAPFLKARVEKACEEAGVEFDALAEHLGKSRSWLSRQLSREHVDGEMLREIAEFLGFDVERFLT